MSKFSVTGLHEGRTTSVIIEADDAQQATAVAAKRGIKVSGVQPFGERGRAGSSKSEPTRYEDVPIVRRSRFVTWLFFIGGFFWFVAGVNLALMPVTLMMMVWSCWLMWSGPVYTPTLDNEGRLKVLGLSTKVVALVLTLLVVLASGSTLWRLIGGGPTNG